MYSDELKTTFGEELYSKLMGTKFAVSRYKKIQESSQELNKLAIILKNEFDVKIDFTIVQDDKGDVMTY